MLQGCINYDRLSQEKMYRHFYAVLFGLCNKFFDDEHDIKTALNNGMLQVFNHIEKFDATKGDLQAWIYAIVRNAAISHVRSKNKQTKTQEFTSDVQLETSANIFEDASQETIAAYLKTLTLTTRAVFNLFYVEGYLIKEIASNLNIKEGTVKWHLNDGRNKLKLFYSAEEKSLKFKV